MQKAHDLKEYREELRESLDNDFLRTTLDNFAVAYRAGRANAFKGMDVRGLISDIAASKDEACRQLRGVVPGIQGQRRGIGRARSLCQGRG